MSRIKGWMCSACRAELAAEENRTPEKCPYCGGGPLMERSLKEGTWKPDYILPFRLSKEEVMEKYREFTRTKLLLPSAFTDRAHIEEVQGVYVPFRLYSGSAKGKIVFDAGDIETVREGNAKNSYLNLYEVRRAGEMEFDRVPLHASAYLQDALVDSLEPFSCQDLQSFEPAALDGFCAEMTDADEEVCDGLADEQIRSIFGKKAQETIEHRGIEVKDEKVRVENTEVQSALFPLWLLPTVWENKTWYLAVNGQSGEMYCDCPVSGQKRWGFTAVILAVLLAVFYLLMRSWLYAGAAAVLGALMISSVLMAKMRPAVRRKRTHYGEQCEFRLTAEEERMTGRQSAKEAAKQR